MTEILIIDDTRSIRELLTELLESEGYKVMSAAEGASGLTALISTPSIQLIILDLEMPIMDGHEFIKIMKTFPDAPPIIITSAGPYRHYPEYINLPKPYDVLLLLRILSDLVKKSTPPVALNV